LDYLEKLIEQAPWAAALTIVVIVFVRYLKSESDARRKRDEAHDKTVKQLIKDFETGTQECHQVQLKTVGTVEVNNERLETNTGILREVKVTLENLNRPRGAA